MTGSHRSSSKQPVSLEPPPVERENEVDPITSLLTIENFNPALETKVLIHGWMSGGNSSFAVDIRNSYLESRDCNIIVVDWAPLSSNLFYPIPMQDTRIVGGKLARLLDYLVKHHGADLNRVHLVGHSLGAHAAGYAGSLVTTGKLARITGLDPALPGFRLLSSPDRRLDLTDAEFVDVIHTCGGVLGYWDPIGHADFYPNGGAPSQPGCCCGYPEIVEACSHGRAHEFFAESVISREFLARRCVDWRAFITGKCETGEEVVMGDRLDKSARGAFYLVTAAKKPYAMGENSSKFKPFTESFISCTKNDSMEKFCNACIGATAEQARQWGEDYFTIADKLDKIKFEVMDRLKILYRADCPFSVVNHGDLWVNNMMFKYDEGQIEDVILNITYCDELVVMPPSWRLQ
ncbi:endothelial lipase-like [Ctenocephalides felis]|uniref:endothelial lipase-like n=1 Tax=Ctenocephalides felis TaxID=7515 RepID=UPI000E6E4825|nr:endothelial lipase-like [Ctenocephalides felis]